MGKPNIYVDETALDNADWRRLVGAPAHSIDPSGETEVLVVEFVVQATSSDTLVTRIQETETDFVKNGARVQFKPDDASSSVLYDWMPGDSKHPSVVTSLEWVAESTPTLYSVIMRFYCTAARYPQSGSGGSGGATPTMPLSGQTTEIRIVEEYAEDGTVSISASGHFGPSIANTSSPFTLTNVENDGTGFAKFKMTGTLPAYTAGMRLVVTGTAGYNATHIINSISGQYAFSGTGFGAGESGLSASGQFQSTTSGETNYQTNRDTILADYLGVDTNGQPDATTGRVLLLEHLVKNDPSGNDVDFILTAGPQKVIISAMVSGSENVTRGFDLQVAVSEPPEWFPEAGPKPKMVSATGTFTVHKDFAGSPSLYQWYVLSKSELEARVANEANVNTGGMKLVSTLVTINHAANQVRFTHLYHSNWSGVLTFSREYATSTRLDYTAWSDADGYDVLQRPNRAAPKTVVITTTRVGEGKADLTPPLPTEAGYTYIEVTRDTQDRGPYITEFSTNTFYQYDVRGYARFRLKGGGGSAAIQQVNPSV